MKITDLAKVQELLAEMKRIDTLLAADRIVVETQSSPGDFWLHEGEMLLSVLKASLTDYRNILVKSLRGLGVEI